MLAVENGMMRRFPSPIVVAPALRVTLAAGAAPQLLVSVVNREVVLRIGMMRLLHGVGRSIADDALLCAATVQKFEALVKC